MLGIRAWRTLRSVAVGAASAAGFVVAFASTAFADQVVCYPWGCTVQVSDPGHPVGAGDSGAPTRSGLGGPAQCVDHGGQAWPCFSAVFGWWSNTDECYYRLAVPQPPAGDPVWAGHQAGDGAVYEATCPNTPGTGGGTVWRRSPPDGFGGVLPPAATLALQALSKLPFPALRVATAPAEHTFVHLETFLWLPAGQWRPLAATAAIGGRSVTLQATPATVTWDMGEGQVSCAGPGVAWNPAGGEDQTSPCSYTYQRSSIGQPGSGNDRAYVVRATVTYRLHWQCSGTCDQAAGELAARGVASQPVRLRVLERQSVVVGTD